VGDLVARLRGLRALARDVARQMDAGRAPARDAAILKLLGTKFEQDVLEAGRAVRAEVDDPGLDAMVDEVQLAMPGISLRGGATEILSGIIAKAAA